MTIAFSPRASDAGILLNGTEVATLNGGGLPSKILSINATVGSNALTITLNPCVLDFRSATLTSGTVNTRLINSDISTVISSGSTGGTVNGVKSRIVVLAIDNAGTVVLGWTNLAGGLQLDETNLITTTAEGGAGGADSANVIYTTVAVTTPSPYRVVGYVESTQTTAGTWATAPSTIQGYGGQALAAMSSLGYGQTSQVVTRTSGTTYYNTSGKPRFGTVYGRKTGAGDCSIGLTINGGTPTTIVASYAPADASTGCGSYVIGVGESYVLTNFGYTAAFIVTERT